MKTGTEFITCFFVSITYLDIDFLSVWTGCSLGEAGDKRKGGDFVRSAKRSMSIFTSNVRMDEPFVLIIFTFFLVVYFVELLRKITL